MREDDSIIKILKNSARKCFETETSTEAGRMNLFTGLLCVFMFIVAISTDTIDKILTFINNEYEAGLPAYAILFLFFMVVGYFAYCINKVASINKFNEEEKIKTDL